MPDVDLVAVLGIAVVLFVLGAAYYAALGTQLAQVSAAAAQPGTPPWTIAAELVRCLVLATVVVGLTAQAAVDEWTGGLVLGLALWIGFPFVLWTGAVVHERAPVKLAVIHAGDWLIKLLVVTVIASAWA